MKMYLSDPIKLTNWEVVARNDPYMPPEHQSLKIAGILLHDTAYPSGVRKSGKEIVTSNILSVSGRTVRTVSSVYELVGPPSHAYAQWCHDHGIAIDTERPIAMKQKARRK